MSTASIQEAAYNNAVDTLNTALNFSDNAVSIVNGTGWSTNVGIGPPAPVFVNAASAAATANRVAAPTLPEYSGIAAPTRPTLPSFTVPNIGNIPELAVAAPTLVFPTAPTTPMPPSPGNAPEFVSPALPAKPSLTLPTAPTFAPVALPESPLVEMPYFDLDADFGDVTAPTNVFEYGEREYQSALLDATKAKLLDDILNGGYGIDDEDERRLWERARDRELATANTKIDELSRMHAARGFTLPSGSLYAQQEAVQQDALDKVSSLSRDIMIKKADLYVENRKFTITAATQLEDILLKHFGFAAERALNAARLQVELGMALFNAQLQKFNSKVEAYRSYAAAFESRVRAALTAVEVFKAKIEGAKLTVETQKLYADVYQTQITGVNAMANLYKTEMEAAQVAASIENLKLQAFRAQVETYAERVRARGVEFDMFKAQIDGEVAKVTAFDASVRAHTAQIQGYEAKARTADIVARTEIAQANAQLDTYKTDMDRYRADIAVVTEKIRSVLQQYATRVQEYTAFTGAMNNADEISVRAQESSGRNYVAYTQVVGDRLRVMVDQIIKDMEVRAGVSNNAAQVAAQLGSAWASSVTGLSATIENNA